MLVFLIKLYNRVFQQAANGFETPLLTFSSLPISGISLSTSRICAVVSMSRCLFFRMHQRQYTCEVRLNPVQFCFFPVDSIHLLAKKHNFLLGGKRTCITRF